MKEIFENQDKHPAYGMLSFSRVSGGSPGLFGSAVEHNHKISLRLKRGHVIRELNNDWYMGDELLFEVEMSYTQFAELISSMNTGDGVPVTIRWVKGEGPQEPVEIINKKKQYIEEFEEKNKESCETAKNLIKQLSDIFSEKRPLKAKEREEVLQMLTKLYHDVTSTNPFIMKQYVDAMEKISAEAKGEIEAFVQHKMNSLAIAALAQETEALNDHITENTKNLLASTELPTEEKE